MPSPVPLANRQLLRVSGRDSSNFLQGQLTQDVNLAVAERTLFAGIADAKGRLLWCGHLLRLQDGAFALLALADTADALLTRLRGYVLRSRVELDLPKWTLQGQMELAPVPAGTQRLALAGDPSRHLLISTDPVQADATWPDAALQAWDLANIRRGLPEVAKATSAEFIPQTVNLDLLDGISFTKGCYTGQEIVARTRYLGRVKRRMLRFEVGGPPPLPGTTINSGRGASGQVVQAAARGTESELLATVYLDDLPGGLCLEGQPDRPLRRLELPYPVPS